MRYHDRASCLAALCAAWLLFACMCDAKPSFTNTDYAVSPGQPFNLTWTGASGPVDINVVNGTEDAVKVVWWIAHNDTSTSFVWTPPDALPTGNYMFEIIDSSGAAYSGQFQYTSKTTTSPPPTTPSSPSPTLPPSTNSTTPAAPPTSPAAAASAPAPDPELSAGAKAGIAIGGVAGALIGMAVCGAVFYRRGQAAGFRAAMALRSSGAGGAREGLGAGGGVGVGGVGVGPSGSEAKEMFHELETRANLPEMQGSGSSVAGGSSSVVRHT